jgi:hypothetical protein
MNEIYCSGPSTTSALNNFGVSPMDIMPMLPLTVYTNRVKVKGKVVP